MQFTDYISINTLRNVLDIALVFVIVYVVLKLLRGTRAVPTVVGLVLSRKTWRRWNSCSATRSRSSGSRSSYFSKPRSGRR